MGGDGERNEEKRKKEEEFCYCRFVGNGFSVFRLKANP
jgi:hypothetical protein